MTDFIDCNDLVGIPFNEETNNCYDVLREIFKRGGKNIPKTNISVCACKDVSNEEIHEHLIKFWEPIEEPEVPCGVRFKPFDPRFADHIGAYIGLGYFVHATISRGVCIDKLSDWKRAKKVIGYYRYVGPDYTD